MEKRPSCGDFAVGLAVAPGYRAGSDTVGCEQRIVGQAEAVRETRGVLTCARCGSRNLIRGWGDGVPYATSGMARRQRRGSPLPTVPQEAVTSVVSDRVRSGPWPPGAEPHCTPQESTLTRRFHLHSIASRRENGQALK